MKIKVCGITRAADAELACELGAWAVGFIFAPNSPRYITPEKASAIAVMLPKKVERVGVFVNATKEFIDEARALVGLTIVQLHGSETPEEAEAIGGRIIKAVRAGLEADVKALAKFKNIEAFLIDGPRAGIPCDRKLAILAKKYGNVILAGGLTKDNVKKAVTEVAPFAIDLSSSLEVGPGIKDPAKMRAFFKEASALK